MSNETILGKISEVSFGKKDGRFGLWVTLSGEWSVMSEYTCWDPQDIEVTEYTKWSEEDRNKEMSKIMRKVSELMNDAKVSNVNELLSIPVEFTSKENRLDTWRILTEVL